MAHATRWLTLALALGACSQDGSRMEEAAAQEAAPSDPIALAMSAAPAAIGRNATIMQIDAAGELVELRAGDNGWLCLPDENPAAPGDAPICLDGQWQTWMAALMAGEAPVITGIGTSYMLQGGPAASNTDPFARTPPEGADWLHDGPHLMILVPDPAMLEGYPTEHGTGGPYVMWAGTPYVHLMVPAGEM